MSDNVHWFLFKAFEGLVFGGVGVLSVMMWPILI